MRLLTALAVVLSFTGTAAASLVINPSFEIGSFAGPGFDSVPASSTDISHWTIGLGRVDWIGSYWQAGDGRMSVDLAGTTDRSISHRLPPVAGLLYNVSFLMAGNPDTPGITTLSLTIGAGAPQAFTFDSTGATAANILSATRTTSIVAGGTSTPITFASTNGSAWGPVLDLVSVAAAPEPAIFTVVAVVLLALACIGRRQSSVPGSQSE